MEEVSKLLDAYAKSILTSDSRLLVTIASNQKNYADENKKK